METQNMEMQPMGPDLEQQTVPGKRDRWYKHLFAVFDSKARGQHQIHMSMIPIFNNFIQATGWHKRPPVPEKIGSTSGAQNEFIEAIIGTDERSEILASAASWYISFLVFKTCEAWVTLLRPVLANVDATSEIPSDNDINIAFNLFKAVFLEFYRKNLALVEIVDEMYNKNLLGDIDDDDERALANQSIFAVVGIISASTILSASRIMSNLQSGTGYAPKLLPELNFLELINPSEDTSPPNATPLLTRNAHHRSKTFTCYKLALDSQYIPLHNLMSRFGKVAPEYTKDMLDAVDPPLTFGGRNDGWIDHSLVRFHTLQKCASIKIEWVESLSLHLEFDRKRKVLKVFRYPSFCFLMYCCKNASFWSQILDESVTSTETTQTSIDVAHAYFREILLTYRLIFGQHKESTKNFTKEFRKWTTEHVGLAAVSDPMLPILCGQFWLSPSAVEIFDEISAEDPSDAYSPTSDFPFLGKRLVELQSFVRHHNFKALWYDRRDKSWWWTFWAVIIIGGATLVFAFLQSALAIAQLVVSKD